MIDIAILFIALVLVASVAWASYRIGREDGWEAAQEWLVRNDLYIPPLSPEFIEARLGTKRTEDRPATREGD